MKSDRFTIRRSMQWKCEKIKCLSNATANATAQPDLGDFNKKSTSGHGSATLHPSCFLEHTSSNRDDVISRLRYSRFRFQATCWAEFASFFETTKCGIWQQTFTTRYLIFLIFLSANDSPPPFNFLFSSAGGEFTTNKTGRMKSAE